MSKTYTNDLAGKLEHILDIKADIKEVIGTESDDFTTYPSLIEEAMSAGAGGGNPYDDAIGIADMIMDGETSADYVWSTIMSDFSGGDYASNWKETVTIDTGEVDQNDEPIFEEKIVLVGVTTGGSDIATALEDYPDLYENIYPIIQNATLTDPSIDDPNFDPQEEGYDYMLDGELYLWNLNDISDPVVEITENGFYPSAEYVSLGFNVNVEGGGEGVVLNGGNYWHVSPVDADTSINISQSANSYVNIISFSSFNPEQAMNEGMESGRMPYTMISIFDDNDTLITTGNNYSGHAYNEGDYATFTLSSTTTIKIYKVDFYEDMFEDMPEEIDPETGEIINPAQYRYDWVDSGDVEIEAGINSGYILEDLPPGTYKLIVKYPTIGQAKDIVILNHIDVSDDCVTD